MFTASTVRHAIEFAIETEKLGQEHYRRLSVEFADLPDVHHLLAELADDEQDHEDQFRALALRLPDRPLDDEQRLLLRAMADFEFFGSSATKCRTVREVLHLSLGLEKATLAFYQVLRDLVGGGTLLDAIIQTEKRHVMRVAERLASLNMTNRARLTR